jgi:aldehyde dehydrogenase (NAD(P)+)
VDPESPDDICFKREAFCGLFAEAGVAAPDVASFLDRAVELANQTLWGTLCATIIVHPKSLRDPSVAAAVERAISNLRYGTVSLNMLAYYSGYFMGSPWGGFPGQDIYDVQSGIGQTFNFLMFDRAQKSVIRAPFRRLDPLTIASKRPVEFGRRLAAFEAKPAWTRFPGLVGTALRA